MLVECYSQKTARSILDSSAAYADASLDKAAGNFGTKGRHPWQQSSSFNEDITWVQQSLLATGSVEFALLTKRSRYINFGQGDLVIYGDSLPRLKQIKLQWDSEGRFNQFFPITKRPDWCGRIQLVRLVENKNSLLIYQAYRSRSTAHPLCESLFCAADLQNSSKVLIASQSRYR